MSWVRMILTPLTRNTDEKILKGLLDKQYTIKLIAGFKKTKLFMIDFDGINFGDEKKIYDDTKNILVKYSILVHSICIVHYCKNGATGFLAIDSNIDYSKVTQVSKTTEPLTYRENM